MNAREEFIRHVATTTVKCATISRNNMWNDEEPHPEINLKINHTPEDYEKFLKQLDFIYDSGYGGQELFGTIWFTNGDWSSRGEYDGSEWWEYNTCPVIPDELTN